MRESLRDELANQNNRINIIMLCDTVCLSCVFSLVADGSPPEETSAFMLNVYLSSVGISIALFTISLWCSVIVVRRLHEHTAAILERKLFAVSEDLQKAWQHQLTNNLPTGAQQTYLVNQAYEKWVAEHLAPLGRWSIHLLSIGVVAMFITAGLLTHTRYLIEYPAHAYAPSAVSIFWSTVIITSATVIVMKYAEDRKEKMKQGVYDNSWQDKSTVETGPFAKIGKASDELFSTTAVRLGSNERMQSLDTHERMERDFCAQTKSLHQRVEALRKESEQRTKTRKDILQILTTAAEELDALPEELSSRLNKVLHDIDEADGRTASAMQSENRKMLDMEGSSSNWSGRSRMTLEPRNAMAPYPIDAHRIPVILSSLRKKLGENNLTTLLRVKNMSDEPLRLKSGVRLKEGTFFKSLTTDDPHNNSVCYQLYPGTEIPPRTEVVVAARNKSSWFPTSGVEGELVYTNRSESWVFRISFRNQPMRNVRRCKVEAARANGPDSDTVESDQYWSIEKDELDLKANNEIAVSIDLLQGGEAMQASFDHRQSMRPLKSGYLLKNKAFGLGLHWDQRWFVLTSKELVYSEDKGSTTSVKIAIKDITNVREGTDMVKKNVFEIHTSIGGGRAYKISAASPAERDDWIKSILDVSVIRLVDVVRTDCEASLSTTGTSSTALEAGFECIESGCVTEVLPFK